MAEINRGIVNTLQNKDISDNPPRRVGGPKRPIKIAVKMRQQTPEEERQSNAAIQLLLTELVRQQMGCEGGK